MIKNFSSFLSESSNNDFRVADIFSSLSRNYETKKVFYTDLLQFSVDEERRDWGDIRQKSKLEKIKTDDAFYKLNFSLDGSKFLLEIKFSISYRGKKDKDAPETAAPEDLERLNTVLEDIKITRINLSSSSLKYNTSSPSDSVKKACEKFMVKMLSLDYDSLGKEI